MIEIRIKETKNRIEEILVTGHGGKKKGDDTVCAAVSAVTQTALSGLLHYGADSVRWEMKPGYLFMHINEATDTKTLSLFSVILSTMILGLRGIAREHPHRIKIETET